MGVTRPRVPVSVRRGGWTNVVLSLAGYRGNTAELTPTGIRVSGGGAREVPFDALAGAEAGSLLWVLGALRLRMIDGSVVEVLGLAPAQVRQFVAAVENGWKRHLRAFMDNRREVLLSAADLVAKAEAPDRYPAACLAAPLLERARSAVEGLPTRYPAGVLAEDERKALATLARFLNDPDGFRNQAIEAFVATELVRMKEFFDGIEKNPLTPEQRLAAVTDEDATLVLAAAGSGKTSVIVAKAAHLVARGFGRADEVLMMSYGKDAASEMAGRATRDLPAHVMVYDAIDQNDVKASTARALTDAQPPAKQGGCQGYSTVVRITSYAE